MNTYDALSYPFVHIAGSSSRRSTGTAWAALSPMPHTGGQSCGHVSRELRPDRAARLGSARVWRTSSSSSLSTGRSCGPSTASNVGILGRRACTPSWRRSARCSRSTCYRGRAGLAPVVRAAHSFPSDFLGSCRLGSALIPCRVAVGFPQDVRMSEPWVSVKAVATHLGVATASVYRWIEGRGLPAHKIGGLWTFKLTEIDSWVRADGANEQARIEKERVGP